MLENRAIVHEFTMGESVNASSFGTNSAIHWLQGFLSGSGFIDSSTRTASLALIKRYISGQALISAFNDCFWFLFVVFLFVIIPTAIIKKRVASTNPVSPG
jgi:hypothetical protein